jgi:hypothetical protein
MSVAKSARADLRQDCRLDDGYRRASFQRIMCTRTSGRANVVHDCPRCLLVKSEANKGSNVYFPARCTVFWREVFIEARIVSRPRSHQLLPVLITVHPGDNFERTLSETARGIRFLSFCAMCLAWDNDVTNMQFLRTTIGTLVRDYRRFKLKRASPHLTPANPSSNRSVMSKNAIATSSYYYGPLPRR